MAEAKIYYQEDCNLSLLDGQTIAIIGYGSQGHAHALNLKESGCNVIIGLYEGSKSWAKAEAQGFEVYTAAEAAKKANINILPSSRFGSISFLYISACNSSLIRIMIMSAFLAASAAVYTSNPCASAFAQDLLPS